MDKTDIRIPTDEELTAYMEKSAVSANGAYGQSPVVLMVDDAAIGTLGNFSASIGKAKSKKTFNVTAIAASALKNGTVLKYRSSFPEDKRTVLYIDTEQGRHHCQKVLKSIPPVKRPILFPDSCNGRMTARFTFIPFSIRTRMTRMPVVTSARN